MLRILKDLINRLFGSKDKKINKQEPTLVVDNTKNQDGMSENAYFSTIEEHFTFDEDISEEYRNELKNHLKESIEQKVHPWDFEKNLDFKLKESDKTYYLYMYYLTYIDIHENDLFDKFSKLWFENNLDDTTKSDEEINNEALRLLKYEVLGFKTINGSKEEVEHKKEFEEIVDNDWIGTKSDNLDLLIKEWDQYLKKSSLNEKRKF